MARKPRITLGFNKLTYALLATFAQSIHNGFVLLVAIFATPNPLMATFQTHIDALNDCIQAWGSLATRTRTDLNNLREAARIVRADLRMLAAYAQNLRPDDPNIWMQIGFSVTRDPLPAPALQIVQNFRIFISRTIPGPEIRLKWKRPLDTRRSDITVYVVQYSNVPVQPELRGTRGVVNALITTETSMMIDPPYVGANYFWVTGYNSAGYGVSSDLLLYNAPGKLV